VESLQKKDIITCLVQSTRDRAELREVRYSTPLNPKQWLTAALVKLMDELPSALQPRVRVALRRDWDDVVNIFNSIMSSEFQKNQILRLGRKDGKKFLAVLQAVRYCSGLNSLHLVDG
jgi:hypothetical protein